MKDLVSKNLKINTFDPPFICYYFRSVELEQSFTSLRYQCISYKMSSTTITKQHARSSSNVELIDYLETDGIEKATERRHKTTVSLGKVA